jgi:uncharacterized protein YjlB
VTLSENAKRSVERLTGWRSPSRGQLAALLQLRKPLACQFSDDGFIPNNPFWPALLYRSVLKLPRTLDPAAIWEATFEGNGWNDSWRGEIYDWLHYHSRIHEVLGIARGTATVRLGGNKGRTFKLKAGDAVILPAGTGHQCLAASKSFLAVGAYPPAGTYDECRPTVEEHERGQKSVRRVGRPRKDPVFGADGPLLEIWKANTKK